MKRLLILFAALVLAVAPAGAQQQQGQLRQQDTIRILAIGNSFSVDAVEQNLWELFNAAGIPVIIGNLYIGGCTLERHFVNSVMDKAAYSYRKVVDGVLTKTPEATLAFGLADEPWDYVSFQQASGVSGIYETYEPYFQGLRAYARRRVPATAVFMWYQTWAYSADAPHKEFPRYDCDQMKMYRAIMDASRMAAKEVPILIPAGTAIQNARSSKMGDVFNRDGYHLERTFGRYTAACAWFEAISGISVVGNSYHPDTISDEVAAICQRAAHAACKKPYKVTAIK